MSAAPMAHRFDERQQQPSSRGEENNVSVRWHLHTWHIYGFFFSLAAVVLFCIDDIIRTFFLLGSRSGNVSR